MEVEIRPANSDEGQYGPESVQFAVPGGLISVGTKIDPTLCRASRGQADRAVARRGRLAPVDFHRCASTPLRAASSDDFS